MAIKERRERDKKQIRDQIISAALELFHNNGYESVTMRDIAKKIEYSPATIYLYYKDKAAIFHDLYEEGFKKFYIAQCETLSSKDPYDRLIKHGEAYLKFAMENKALYDIMFIMRVTGIRIKKRNSKMDWDTSYKSYQFLRQNITDCIEAGYFLNGNPDILSFSIWSFIHGISSLIIRDRTAIIPDEHLQQVIQGSLNAFFKNVLSSKK